MTHFQIVAAYAGTLMILFVVLSARVAYFRNTTKTGLGMGEDTTLNKAIRVQGNFAEYVPIAVMGMFLVASVGTTSTWLHWLGAALLLGRLLHALGLSKTTGRSFGRVIGTMLTWGVLMVEGVYLLVHAFGGVPG